MHALIVGARGVGKSTLIRRVLEQLNQPLIGFETKKEDALADEVNGSPVSIYEAGKEHLQTEENLVGHCKNKHAATMKEAFDRYAPKLTVPVPQDRIVVMDELGFMESRSEAFCNAVMGLLDGEAPVIAAVKDKDIPFLEAVRSHPNTRCFFITPDNRDALYFEVLEFMKAQVKIPPRQLWPESKNWPAG